LEYPHVTS
jgi:hypothetical protein